MGEGAEEDEDPVREQDQGQPAEGLQDGGSPHEPDLSGLLIYNFRIMQPCKTGPAENRWSPYKHVVGSKNSGLGLYNGGYGVPCMSFSAQIAADMGGISAQNLSAVLPGTAIFLHYFKDN